jgi:alkanesulfonate monooxygenase SsuD/methylene tetrahydromethanopterin reductase-like flavin-dependent oxidoreductase (luciferase family)
MEPVTPAAPIHRAGRPLKIGVILPFGEVAMAGATARWADILATAQAAEAAGFDSIWLPDHFLFPPPEHETDPIGTWEGTSLLAALAAVTRRVELGSLVLCTGFRNPALVAKMADTIDEISGGRLILGLGAGWHEREFYAFGYPFDHRVSRFEEALVIIQALLRTGRVDFAGRYHQARECELRLRGPRPAGLPIMIGSYGPRMLRLAAKYADSWNTGFGRATSQHSGARIPRLRAAVDAACVAEGRDPATLARTAGVLVEVAGSVPYPPGYPAWSTGPGQRAGQGELLQGTPDELAEAFRAYAREGISHIQLWVNPMTVAGIERVAEALALLDRG